MRTLDLILLTGAVAAGLLAPSLAGAQAGDSSQLTAQSQTRARSTWGGTSLLLDASRMGDGRLRDSEGHDLQIDRAELRLGGNNEFELVVTGDSTYDFAGTWTGDLRFGPISLDLRAAFGHRVGGMGRAWVQDASWDRDRTFNRVELDGWTGGHAFQLYFDAETRTTER
jgi:hypothetical protein